MPGLQFNITYGTTQVSFLDTTLTIQGSKIMSDLYIKATDRNQLLHTSFHPPGVFKSIPKSQVTRVNRIVNDPERRYQ